MSISRYFVNICTDELAVTRDFYVNLLGLAISFDSDWFVLLTGDTPLVSIGLIQRDHELVPEAARGGPTGMYVTFIVDEVERIFARAKELGIPVVEEPTDLFYGQRRLLITDPNGVSISRAR